MRDSILKVQKNSRPKFLAKARAAVVLGALGLSLAGCVVYPDGGGYYGGGYGYAPAPVYYGPPVAFDFGFGGGWGHRWR